MQKLSMFKLNWFQKNYQSLSFIIFIISCVLIIVGKLHHEIWLDEWQSFGIAKSAKNPIELYSLRNYEGHPYLYYFLLHILYLFTKSNLSFIMLHLFFSLAAMYYLIVKSNFSLLIKLLLVLSVYFSWEYTVLNRVYCICLFVIFLNTYLLKEKKLGFWTSIILFTILCQLDVYSAGIAILLGGYYFLSHPLTIRQKLVYIFIGLLNFVILFISIQQPIDSSFTFREPFHFNTFNFEHYIHHLNFGFLTLLHEQYYQWNCLYKFPKPIVFIVFLSLLLGMFYFIQNNVIRFCMFIAFIGISYINIQISACALRHLGFYFLLFIISLWLDHSTNKTRLTIFLVPILLLQLVAGYRMYMLDFRSSFSMSKPTAEYIMKNFSGHTIVGMGEMSICGLSAHFGKPIINIITGKEAWYYNWNIHEEIPVEYNEKRNIELVNKMFKEKGNYVLSLNNDKRIIPFIQKLDYLSKTNPECVKKMPEFTGSFLAEENYYLFKIDSLIH